MKEMIRTEGLTKVYDGKAILNHVSLTVNRGEIGRLLQEISAHEFENLRRKKLQVGVRGTAKWAGEQLAKGGYKANTNGDEMLKVLDERAVRHPEHIARLLADAGIPLYLLRVVEEELESYF